MAMATGTDPMAPGVSPGAMSKTLGVRRVNNMPVYILASVLGAFLLVMALVAVNRAATQRERGLDRKLRHSNRCQ